MLKEEPNTHAIRTSLNYFSYCWCHVVLIVQILLYFFNCEIKFFHIPWRMYDFLSLNMYSFTSEYSRLSKVTAFVFVTLINGNTCAYPRNMDEIKIRKTISQFVSDIMFLTWENSNESSKFLVEIYKKKTWHPFSIVMFSEHCPQYFISIIC